MAAYASYRRSYDTVNAYFRTLETLTPADLQSTARKYFTDAGLIVTTLSKDSLPTGIERAPSLAVVTPAAAFTPAAVTPPRRAR